MYLKGCVCALVPTHEQVRNRHIVGKLMLLILCCLRGTYTNVCLIILARTVPLYYILGLEAQDPLPQPCHRGPTLPPAPSKRQNAGSRALAYSIH